MSVAQAEPGSSGLFAQVNFHIVLSDTLDLSQASRIQNKLIENGGEEHTAVSQDCRFDLEGLTHVITSTIDFEGYDDVEDALLNVVTPTWVEQAIHKGKLPNPKQYSPDPRMIFAGLVVCIASDIPDGDKDAIIGGVLAMGGLYSGTMSRLVTHVVALTMKPVECQIVIHRHLECQVVLPHWFDDCLRLGKRIKEDPYLLPHPEIANPEINGAVAKVSRPDLVTSMHIRPDHLPIVSGTDSQRAEQLDVFKDRNMLLSQDLGIASHLRATIEDMIGAGGGKVVTSVMKADTLVCYWREGAEYRVASQQGKTVGNLPWLYHLITHNSWTSPMRRLLHYPFVKNGLPGFDKFRLSLSNYSGEARIYLESLARAAGCEFTKTFKTDNTHLITAHKFSEKCDAAQEWGIDIVNHLWLEESYAKWSIQPLSNPRYVQFPDRTNLSEVVGQTSIDRDALEKHFYQRPTQHPAALEDLEDVDWDEEAAPGEQDDIFVTADGNKGAEVDLDEAEAEAPVMQARDQNVAQGNDLNSPKTPAARSKKSPSAVKGAKAPKTPAARLEADGKENVTPLTTTGRSAKTKATAKLHEMAPDIEKYQKEMKRVGGVTHGGKRAKEEVVNQRSPSLKRSASAEDGPESDEDEDEPQKKRAKGAPVMKLLITGWDQTATAKAPLRDLGVMITEDYTKCTHVAAAKIVRTKKFLCALAYAPTIVSISFIEDCLKQKKLLPVEKYLLKDTVGEKNYRIRLSDSLKKAAASKRSLLEGMEIYVTKDVHGGFDTFEAIIKANGGTPQLYQARPGTVHNRRAGSEADTDDDADSGILYLIRGDSPAEAKLAERFRKAATSSNWTPRVVKTDWLTDAALAQDLKWKSEYEYHD